MFIDWLIYYYIDTTQRDGTYQIFQWILSKDGFRHLYCINTTRHYWGSNKTWTWPRIIQQTQAVRFMVLHKTNCEHKILTYMKWNRGGGVCSNTYFVLTKDNIMCIFANCVCLPCIVISYVYLLYLMFICCTSYVYLLYFMCFYCTMCVLLFLI